jgi:hypothetical protein
MPALAPITVDDNSPMDAIVVAKEPTRYATKWDWLFECGPGYWRPTVTFWIILCASCVAVVALVGIAALVFLGYAASDSRTQWQLLELQRRSTPTP